ncbi:MAG: NAD-dependent epimerase/dehydratase family protein [Xanthomonadales bacterium]|nr:NAD-dependent epimerase/dehydratase family protein [Xanthomonadales bacterium]
MTQTETVLLTGASAQVGLHILPKLLDAGFDTCALSRQLGRQLGRQIGRQTSRNIQQAVIKDGPSGARLSWFSPDQFNAKVSNENSGRTTHSQRPEILISAGPIKLASQWLDRCRSVRKLVCLSTTSVFSKADSSDPAEKAQIEEIIQAEQQLITACSERNVDLTILRPTLIYGCGMDENISRLAQFIRKFGFLPLAGAAKGLRQPLHVADLAEVITLIVRSEMLGRKDYTVAGGSTLSYRDMVAKVFRALGKTERILHVPPRLLATAVAVAGKLTSTKSMNATMVLRQNQDLVFDGVAIQQRFGFEPRAFEPSLDDFQLPAELQRYVSG